MVHARHIKSAILSTTITTNLSITAFEPFLVLGKLSAPVPCFSASFGSRCLRHVLFGAGQLGTVKVVNPCSHHLL
jgi:hypothetical protein